jgi:hypothetical protein
MNFIEDYLSRPAKEQHMILRNMMHRLKYDQDDEITDTLANLRLPEITPENRLPLVTMAVYLGHAYGKRMKHEPEWVFDPGLVLEEPYKGPGYRNAWFFCGEQVFYRHNYFADPRSLDVL